MSFAPSSHVLRRATATALRRQLSSAAGTSVGFIGLGNMGGHMVNNLLSAGVKARSPLLPPGFPPPFLPFLSCLTVP